ncbi:MAG: hypothetical protein AB1486_31280 [Planctomycetota bacterium]
MDVPCYRPWLALTVEKDGRASPCRAPWLRESFGRLGPGGLGALWGGLSHLLLLRSHVAGEWWGPCSGVCPVLCLGRGTFRPLLREELVHPGLLDWPEAAGSGELPASPILLRLERMPPLDATLQHWGANLRRLELSCGRRRLSVSDLAFGVIPWLEGCAKPGLEIAIEIEQPALGPELEQVLLKLYPRPRVVTIWLRGLGRPGRAGKGLEPMAALARCLGALWRVGWTVGHGPPRSVVELARVAREWGIEYVLRRTFAARTDPFTRHHYLYLERFAKALEEALTVYPRWLEADRLMWLSEPLLAGVQGMSVRTEERDAAPWLSFSRPVTAASQ